MKTAAISCPALVLATAFAACVADVASAMGNWVDDKEMNNVDDEGFEVEDYFEDVPSLAETARLQLELQKRRYEAEKEAEEAIDLLGEDEEPEVIKSSDSSVFIPEDDGLGQLEDPLEDPLDLEADIDEEPTPDSDASKGTQEVEEVESEVPTYNGMAVETKDEDGTVFDVSGIKQEDDTPVDIKEFDETVPTFKKEEEEKEKKKEAKRKNKGINPIEAYEQDRQVFLEIKERNTDRFASDIENVEAEVEAPRAPSLWRRFKNWFDQGINRLNDKYGSEDS